MDEDLFIDEQKTSALSKIADFLEHASLVKIINKLTDYAEILSEGKLSAIINYNYSLNREQLNEILQLLLKIRALSRISLIAQKGTRDLEDEYISNIFSDSVNPESISSFISIRNILENRLTHQTQQYNMNMGKSNTTQSMPINELRGHVKTYIDLSKSDVTVSSKAQHGFIAATLHDAYITFIARSDWWNDRTYMKFFFNEDDPERRNQLVATREPYMSLIRISGNINQVLDTFSSLKLARLQSDDKKTYTEGTPSRSVQDGGQAAFQNVQARMFNDRLMMTPFGRQYGNKIDSIIIDLFTPITKDTPNEDTLHEIISGLFKTFTAMPETLQAPGNSKSIIDILDLVIFMDMSVRAFAEKFIYNNRKESFLKFYSDKNKDAIEAFLMALFSVYFEEKFSGLFRIIQSGEMRKYACAFIIKRIYLTQGENLTTFGFFLIKAIARVGHIKIS